jgi:hypothetical protein
LRRSFGDPSGATGDEEERRLAVLFRVVCDEIRERIEEELVAAE